MIMLIPIVEIDCYGQTANYIISINIENGEMKSKALFGEYSISESEFTFIKINRQYYYDEEEGESLIPYNVKPIMNTNDSHIYAAETIAIIPIERETDNVTALYDIACETYMHEYGCKVKPNSAFIRLSKNGFAIIRLTRKMNIYEAVDRIINFTNTYILDVIGETDYVLLN
jgi:hypothetical protein